MTPDPRTFLEHFPAPRRGPIANWFHDAVRAGAQTPLQVLAAVRATCHRRLAWGDTPDAPLVLARLDTDQAGALAYVQSLIAYEALPYGERQRVKAERRFAYLKHSMMGKEATAAQLSFLRALGYMGTPPTDRAAASVLIDQIRQAKGHA